MKSLLLTGSSTGFGKNVALAMASRGWRVIATMRDVAKGEALLEAWRAMSAPGMIDLLALDVTCAQSVTDGVAEALRLSEGRIDALLNNAGFSALGPFEEMADAQCRAQMETNFFGALAVTRAVLPTMRAARAGRIVTVTSNAVNSPHPMLSLYAASKWALEGWSEALAMEMAPFGVHVSVLQPGAHRTPFASNVVPAIPPQSAYADWLSMAMPGVGNLDAWGRPPEAATDPIVAALTGESDAFRTAIGQDTEIFAALKGAFPFELRAAILRAIVGLPAPGAFVEEASSSAPSAPALAKLADAIGQSDELRHTITAIVGDALARMHQA
ncbi:SDR family oxidoreductase [Sphingobium sp. WCS2017Hpa-17]|uniref:SDR family oxidoreductase n=1 Tax=Sphingobium sp. WCS2017Hpa-17 TaxID=3073638 RepID=UPI00288A200F|nr:SDR family oxidoreductase [Sphingobium sp. WCS2017Hpa-17]